MIDKETMEKKVDEKKNISALPSAFATVEMMSMRRPTAEIVQIPIDRGCSCRVIAERACYEEKAPRR